MRNKLKKTVMIQSTMSIQASSQMLSQNSLNNNVNMVEKENSEGPSLSRDSTVPKNEPGCQPTTTQNEET